MNRMTSSDLINSRNSIIPSTKTPSNFMKIVFSVSDDDEYYDYDEHCDSEDNSDTNEKSFIDTKMDSNTKY